LAKEDLIEKKGIILDSFRGGTFKVQLVDPETNETLDNIEPLLCRPNGRLKKYNIKLLVGDLVDVEVSSYDLTQGRITYRHS
jgi:translation initiation factor IF-1